MSQQLTYDVKSNFEIGDVVCPSERMTPMWAKCWKPGGAKIESICVGLNDHVWFYMESIALPFQAHELELVHKGDLLGRIKHLWK